MNTQTKLGICATLIGVGALVLAQQVREPIWPTVYPGTDMVAGNAGTMVVTNWFSVGGVSFTSTNLRPIIKTNFSITLPNIGLLTRQTATTTVWGASVGDVVNVSFTTAMPFGLSPQNFRVSATDTVEGVFQNILTLSGISGATYSGTVTIIK